jgi:hypothetical protein
MAGSISTNGKVFYTRRNVPITVSFSGHFDPPPFEDKDPNPPDTNPKDFAVTVNRDWKYRPPVDGSWDGDFSGSIEVGLGKNILIEAVFTGTDYEPGRNPLWKSFRHTAQTAIDVLLDTTPPTVIISCAFAPKTSG